jgi:hypothetical protein
MPEIKVLLTALLTVGLLAAVLAPAPRESRPFEAVLVAVAAFAIYLIAIAVAIEVSVHAGALAIAPGVLVFCLSCWLSRGTDRGGGGGGEDDTPEPEPDSPLDWHEFDRLRGEWERTRNRPLVPVA